MMFKVRHRIAALSASVLALACHADGPQPFAPETPHASSPAQGIERAHLAQHAVVRLERIGDPTWRPEDCHQFSAPIGTEENEFADFAATALALLPPPNHRFHPDLLVGPGAPHAPPYTAELARGVAALGFEESRVFDASAFTGSNGIWLACMVVPDPGTTGSSPDFATGPIIPNTLFPIVVSAVITRNGKPVDQGGFSVPPLDGVNPPFNVEGHSHFPLFSAEAGVFLPEGVGPQGNYKNTITMTDQQDNGWIIHAHYVVKKQG